MPTVLLVDDDPMVLRALSRAIAGLAAEVVTLDRGFGLLNRIVELQPAVVVLDVRMPGLDGASLLQLIRQDPAIRATRVLLLSGMDPISLAAVAADCGADAWMCKGAGTAAAVAAVRRLLPLGTGGPRVTPPLGTTLPLVERAVRADESPPTRPRPGSTLRGMPAVRWTPSRLGRGDG